MTKSIIRSIALAGVALPTLAAAQTVGGSNGDVTITAPLPTPTAPQARPLSAEEASDPGLNDPGAIVVTARRREERAQDVPIALSVLSNVNLQQQATFSIQQITQLAPTLQFSSSNPRNTSLNIRGLGVSVGLTNDGLEQGVGFYVDGIYSSRPASAAFDLTDVERVEVLRGPQGTLFGKNTTAGAINITTQRPSFTPEGQFEASLGTHQFVQVKGSVSAPLVDDVLAGRIAVGYTSRDGYVRSTKTGRNVNDLDNFAVRGQLLWKPAPNLNVRLIGDYNLQNPDCCTQVYVRTGSTLRAPSRQFAALAQAARPGYALPSTNPYDRLADVDGKINARSEIGGVGLIAELDLGTATATSISSWRYWRWLPANDRDYTALDVLRQSANRNQQDAYSQEFRLSSNGKNTIDYTVGVYAYNQLLKGQNVTEYGAEAARFQAVSATKRVPSDPPTVPATTASVPVFVPTNLLDGYFSRSANRSIIRSYAGFGQLTWNITPTLHLTPGLRYTYEQKRSTYAQVVGGGPALATLDPNPANQKALLTARYGVAAPQAYDANFDKGALTGDINLSWQPVRDILVYGGYSRGFKSGGLNLAGVPNVSTTVNADGSATTVPLTSVAIIKPERNETFEIGLKTQFFDRQLTANFAIFRSDVTNYQANVVDTSGADNLIRPFLANVPSVRSQGVEFDLSVVPIGGFSGYFRGAYTDATYRSFPNAPCPLELIGGPSAQCNLSGKQLPGVSEWALSAGGEYRVPVGSGEAYIGVDANYRSSFNGDATDSIYTRIDGYTLVNARIGFAAAKGWEIFALVRNVFDKDYLLLVTPQAGSTGFISGLPGDPRTFQVTGRYRF